ncbi:MAG: (2Fe-2S) ferredoxin domain-containing protein [Clostridia bacterium]|nr:(2Fe-2S) ferredoxin domain-containing protein [Clostridia bacterium]
MIIQICVGSSCHLKGSEKIVELFQETVAKRKLDSDITLAGSFCTGQCNRVGVTVTVNDEVFTGVTPESFTEFFDGTVMKALEKERAEFNGMSYS